MQSSYIQQLRQSKDKATVAYQEFALSTQKFSNYIFCFFEGRDNPYYIPRIKRNYNNVFPINCGGREKVLKVFELISNHKVYDAYATAYFIDRDFNDELINNRDVIFETPCYSIENLYVNQNSFEQILIHEFQFSLNDENFKVCSKLFESTFRKFNIAVTFFNSWYSCLIDIRAKNGINIGAQLQDKFPKGFVTVYLDNVDQAYDLQVIKSIFTTAVDIEDNELIERIKKFEICDSENDFRGKYQLQFLITFLQLLIDDSKNHQNYLKSKIIYPFDGVLNNLRALSLFSNYAKTPASLDKFLKDLRVY